MGETYIDTAQCAQCDTQINISDATHEIYIMSRWYFLCARCGLNKDKHGSVFRTRLTSQPSFDYLQVKLKYDLLSVIK